MLSVILLLLVFNIISAVFHPFTGITYWFNSWIYKRYRPARDLFPTTGRMFSTLSLAMTLNAMLISVKETISSFLLLFMLDWFVSSSITNKPTRSKIGEIPINNSFCNIYIAYILCINDINNNYFDTFLALCVHFLLVVNYTFGAMQI